MKDLRIVFMGTPDFAVASLDILVKNNINVVGVITAPDKPAGRGKKIQQSAIKKYALEQNLNILQPINLKDETFLQELKSLNANLQIVVAFRMLPKVVWNMPEFGTFNLHASLLPQYRGAAPINWAIINGEKESGVTTFFLDEKIDTGKIIDQEKVKINDGDSAGDLHDQLMDIGSKLVLKTTQDIATGNFNATPQSEIIDEQEIKHAPKLDKENTLINWNKKGIEIQNLIRGLNPYPTAYSYLYISDQKKLKLKIYKTKFEATDVNDQSPSIKTDNKNYFKVKCSDGWVYLEDIQLESKKRMNIGDFLRGFSIEKHFIVK